MDIQTRHSSFIHINAVRKHLPGQLAPETPSYSIKITHLSHNSHFCWKTWKIFLIIVVVVASPDWCLVLQRQDYVRPGCEDGMNDFAWNLLGVLCKVAHLFRIHRNDDWDGWKLCWFGLCSMEVFVGSGKFCVLRRFSK